MTHLFENKYCLRCNKLIQFIDQYPIYIHNTKININDFCLNCKYELPYIKGVQCIKCSAHHICYNNCEQYDELQQNVSSLIYNDEVKEWIKLFKFNGDIKIGNALKPLLSIAIKRLSLKSINSHWSSYRIIKGLFSYSGNTNCCNIVTSVPISQQRLLERGFNQAEYLAQFVSNQMKVPYLQLLARVNDFDHNSHLNRLEREVGVKNKFYIKEDKLNKLTKYIKLHQYNRLNIIIVDDIYTTGNTIRACARELRNFLGQNVQVYSITLARA